MKVRIAKMIVMSAVLIPGHVTVMADIEVTAERIDPAYGKYACGCRRI